MLSTLVVALLVLVFVLVAGARRVAGLAALDRHVRVARAPAGVPGADPAEES